MKTVHKALFFFKGNEKENKREHKKKKYAKFEVKVLKKSLTREK